MLELIGIGLLAATGLGAKWFKDTIPPGVTQADVAYAKAQCAKNGNAALVKMGTDGAVAGGQGAAGGSGAPPGASGAAAGASSAVMAALADPCVQKALAQKVKEIGKYLDAQSRGVQKSAQKVVTKVATAPKAAAKHAEKKAKEAASSAEKKAKKLLKGKF